MVQIDREERESIVAAIARNGIIGADGSIPWHSAEDLRLFRKLTLGGTVVMGRRTYQSIGHPLAGRRNIVVSTTLGTIDGVTVVPTFAEAVTAALAAPGPVHYCGGARIYAQALDRVAALHLSHMKTDAEGDVSFPAIDPLIWEVVEEEDFGDFVHRYYRRRREEGV